MTQPANDAPLWKPGDVAKFTQNNPNVVIRWARDGVRFRDGSKRRCPAIRTPGGWRFRYADVMEFLEALAADRAKPDTPPAKPGRRSKRDAQIDAELAAAGFK
jgi:hypothetical protein